MPKLTIAEEFDIALKLAAKDAGSVPSRQAAEDFYGSERKLVEAFAKEWVIEKLAALIRLRRAKERREQDRQFSLVGFTPPRRFTLKNGKELLWGDATLRALKQGRSVVWQQHRDYKHPAVQRFDKAIAFMEKHASEERAITWDEAVAKED
jgi:hypothetical protein